MVTRIYILRSVFFCIFLINLWSLAISLQEENFLESDHIIAGLFRGMGFKGKIKEEYHSIPILSKYLTNKGQTDEFNTGGVRFKKSQYFIPGWADTRWEFRKNITIFASKVSADLNNFPVYIDLFDTDLQQDAQASGNDIFFTDIQGNLLDHEIELYERVYNSSHAHMVAWVKVNISSAQNTVLSIYYGNPIAENQENPTAVWDSNYKGIWHLSENPSDSAPQMKDSTSNINDGTAQGGMDTNNQIEAQIDGGLKFYYGNNINCGTDSSLDLVQEFSVEFWIKIQNETGISSWPSIIGRGDGQFDDGWMLFQNEQSSKIDFVYRDTSETSHWILNTGTALQLKTWYHIVLTYSVSQGVAKLFIDGSQFDTDNTVSEILSSPLGLFFAEDDFNGSLDEIRISDIARSSEWIQTEYNNQKDPSTFYSISTKENYEIDDEWALPALKYRKNVTILATQVSGSANLVDFPVLVNLYDIDLHNSEKVQADGDDIFFVDASGTILDHEIELFNQDYNTTHAELVAWVRIPSLSGLLNTTISMYYGNPILESQQNPSGVWDS
ncbi:MAG: DUF2341 domain-containing protein, partial [Candidatus Hodarchaeota archaeon]